MFLRILAILGAIAAGIMFYLIGNTKAELEQDLSSERQKLASTQNNLSTLQSEHEELQKDATQLEKDLQEANSRISNLNSELAQVQSELTEARRTIDTRQREAAQLEEEAARIRRELVAEKQRADELKESLESEDAETLRANVRELELALLRTEQELQNLGSQAPTPETTEADPRVVLRGSVTEVGEDGTYLIINIGKSEGANENGIVMLRRGPKYIGRARITEVRNDVSIAELMPGSSDVQAGDQAITLN